MDLGWLSGRKRQRRPKHWSDVSTFVIVAFLDIHLKLAICSFILMQLLSVLGGFAAGVMLAFLFLCHGQLLCEETLHEPSLFSLQYAGRSEVNCGPPRIASDEPGSRCSQRQAQAETSGGARSAVELDTVRLVAPIVLYEL
jgi:hypothetical protein